MNGHVLVRVLDGGDGVPEAEREAIFERFPRGEGQTAPGFGLGLAIGAELARRMAGELALRRASRPRANRVALGSRWRCRPPRAPNGEQTVSRASSRACA